MLLLLEIGISVHGSEVGHPPSMCSEACSEFEEHM